MSARETVYVNATTAHVGGAMTYLRGWLDALHARPARRFRYVFLVNREVAAAYPLRDELVSVEDAIGSAGRPGPAARLGWDQVGLRLRLRDARALLFSTGNMALLRSPVPQLLLVRQSLYFSRDYLEGILPRRSRRSRVSEWLRRGYLHASMRQADHVLVPSHAMRDAIATAVPALAERVTVIPYATNLAPPPGPRERGDRPFTFVYPSHYADYKNFQHLLLAARLLVRRGYRFRLRLNAELENFPPHVSAWYHSDRALLQSPDLRHVLERVGPQNREQMAASLADADALVMPSFSEAFGHPYLEAMRRGLPLAASDRPIAREVAGDAALYFDPWDPADIADALARLIEDEALRARLRAAGAARAGVRSWDHYISDFEDHCERILGSLSAV